MRLEKKHVDIANKYCRTVTFYPDPNDPYTVEEVIATKQQAADKKRFILAYLQALESLSPWFQTSTLFKGTKAECETYLADFYYKH